MNRFVDTNVLLYAVVGEEGEESKIERSLDLIDDGGLAFSAQVFGEFYNQATRPSRPAPLSHADAVEFIESLADSPVQPITLAVVRSAMATKDRFQISYWDATIIAAAKALGCEEILSEDLSDGQDYDGCRVVNPFLA